MSIKKWKEGLKGISFTRSSGDHILPKIDNPLLLADGGSVGLRANVNNTIQDVTDFLIPHSIASGQTGLGVLKTANERARIYLSPEINIVAELTCSEFTDIATTSDAYDLTWVADTGTSEFDTLIGSTLLANRDYLWSKWGDTEHTRQFDGLRSVGSVFSIG